VAPPLSACSFNAYDAFVSGHVYKGNQGGGFYIAGGGQ